MKRLSLKEKQILRYPPTPDTWVCKRKSETRLCDTLNSGRKAGKPVPVSRDECGACRRPRLASAPKLWPEYVKAAEKAGIEPNGQPFRLHQPVPADKPAPRIRRGRKRG